MSSTEAHTGTGNRQFGVGKIDFSQTPFTVIWEVTRACDLRCVHCRADAQRLRDPQELTTAEGRDLLDQVRQLASPVFVFTGGDPLRRPDLFDLLAYACSTGVAVGVTPSGTPLLTPLAVKKFRDLGVHRMALSLDGPDAASHDGFRQQPGSFALTLRALYSARDCGLPTQVNTTVTRRNWHLLPEIAARVADVGAATWSAFFLVTTGRARADDQLEAEEFETVFAFLYDLSKRVPFTVRTTAAPHYRRFVLQRSREEKRAGRPPAARRVESEPAPDLLRAPSGVTDGNGLVFVSHTGDVFPSGFLPLSAGNLRSRSLADIYRNSPLFRALRDVAQLEGKCRDCEFVHVCAGSRARAYAETGNFLASEPRCSYLPPLWKRRHAGASPVPGGCG